MRDEPLDFREGEHTIPPRLGAVVRRCLEKSSDRRFQSAKDLAFALREILSGPSNAASDGARPGKRIPALTLAFLVIIGAAAVWFGGRSRTLPVRGAAPIRSLAVLPLIDLSPDQRQEYFAEAMTEELTTRLAKLGNWRVTSRTSVMSYRGTEKRVPEIATELGVDAVVEGLSSATAHG